MDPSSLSTIEVPAPEPYKPPPPIDDTGFLLQLGLGVLAAAVAIAVVVVLVRTWRDRKLASPANLADHELVTLTGVVRTTASPLTAPLSGRSCVAYRARAYVLGDEGPSDGRSVFGAVPPDVLGEPVAFERVAFSLETPQGTIAIGDDQIELAVTPLRVVPASPPRERAFLARFGLADRHDRSGFDEIVIERGAKIAIRGMLRVEHDASAPDERGYRDAAPIRMRLVAPDREPLTVVRIWDG